MIISLKKGIGIAVVMYSPQMGPTFRERWNAKTDRFVRQHRVLRFLACPVSIVVLGAHRVFMFFYGRAKRLCSVMLVTAAFAVSSSFAFPVLTMRAGFASLDVMHGVQGNTALSGPEAAENNDPVDEAESSAAEEETASEPETAQEVVPSATPGEEPAQDAEDTEGAPEPFSSDESNEAVGGKESGSGLGDTVSLSEMLDLDGFATAEADTGAESGGFSADDWRLILVNKQHPIPEDYEVELGRITGSMRCDRRIVGNLMEMLQDAAKDRINLIICSPYRTHAHQEELFNRKIDHYMSGGLSYMDAYTMAAQAVTVPGTSEHEIGLAIDIVSDTWSLLNEGFGSTPAGEWLRKNSAAYGFILRYPEGKEAITGIEYEPWHFRYVGREAATRMNREKLCLEEFWDEYLYR